MPLTKKKAITRNISGITIACPIWPMFFLSLLQN
jgi:hypothetical protein